MIICGIASIPSREKDLRHVLDAIAPQVHLVYVSLNGYKELPDYHMAYTSVLFSLQKEPNLGDAHKFNAVSYYDDAYFISLDDDLIVPKEGFVDYMCEGVDKYNGAVGLHGRFYLPPATNFRNWTGNYRCLGNVNEDKRVNLLGTGVTAFHKSRLKISLSDFPIKNMADCYFSRQCSLQGVPMVVLKHESNYLEYTNPKKTIWNTARDFNEQTKILQSYIK